MNDMDNNLNDLTDLKRDYDSLKYPGDLASDVPLDIERPYIAGRIGAVLALAAALMLGVTCWMIWGPQKDETKLVIIEPTIVNPVKPDLLATATDSNTAVPSTSGIETSQFAGMSAPSWSDISTVSSYSTSIDNTTIPYQSISVPSVDEIDQHLTNEKNQSSKQG